MELTFKLLLNLPRPDTGLAEPRGRKEPANQGGGRWRDIR